MARISYHFTFVFVNCFSRLFWKKFKIFFHRFSRIFRRFWLSTKYSERRFLQALHIVFFINSIIFNLSRLFLALLAKTLSPKGKARKITSFAQGLPIDKYNYAKCNISCRKANIKSQSKRRGEIFAFPLASIFSFSFLITYYI